MNLYREKTTQLLTLPSGATVRMRQPSAIDQVAFMAPKPFESMTDEEKLAFGTKVTCYAMSRMCGPLCFDGQELRIVDKPAGQVADGEIAIEEIPLGDAEVIATAARDAMLNAQRAGREARNTFQEANGAEPGNQRSSAGEIVSLKSGRAPEAKAG